MSHPQFNDHIPYRYILASFRAGDVSIVREFVVNQSKQNPQSMHQLHDALLYFPEYRHLAKLIVLS